jgi:hypothetical protein
MQSGTRVARWYIFEPKIEIWVKFVGSFNGRCMLVYLMAIWSFIRTFGIFGGQLVVSFHVLVSCTKKNLATLLAHSTTLEFWRQN